MSDGQDAPLGDCTGCTDPHSEGTHQMGTNQHPAEDAPWRALVEWLTIGELIWEPGLTKDVDDRALESALDALCAAVRNQTRQEWVHSGELRCDDCGDAHFIDTSVPSAVWNRIADPADMLCTLCIDRRLTAAGIVCDQAEFYFVSRAYDRAGTAPMTPGLYAKMYAESHGEVAAERARADRLAAALNELMIADAAYEGLTSDASDSVAVRIRQVRAWADARAALADVRESARHEPRIGTTANQDVVCAECGRNIEDPQFEELHDVREPAG